MSEFDSTWLAPHEFSPANGACLYAFGIGAAGWAETGLPPHEPTGDGNSWQYVGRAGSTSKGDWFTQVCCVDSSRWSFRRSLIALLRERHDWEVLPRSLRGRRDDYRNYRLSLHDEHELNGWIAAHVVVAQWHSEVDKSLDGWHRDVLAVHRPPLNLAGRSGPQARRIRDARRACARTAAEWALAAGSPSP